MHPRQILWIGNFFSAAHFFLIIYIVGPYLETLVGVMGAGLVITIGAVITFLLFPVMPQLVRRKGAKRLSIILAFVQAVVLTILAGSPSAAVAIACVALACAISPLLAYQLDLLLEATVNEEGTTGRVRTAFLTIGSIALVLAPLIVGALLDGTDRYDRVFFAAAISLTPFIMLFLVERIPEGAPPRGSKIAAVYACMWGDRDFRAVATAFGLLQIFFHLAPLYIPLYLHTVLGMPWDTLGWMFALMVLPFVFLEYPAGYLADRYFGDRLLLVTGFVIMGSAFAALAFVTATTPIAVIVAILILSRVGAALTEAMVEGHFFRRVSERDPNTVSVFRMMRPGGALVAPLLGSAFLILGGYSALFLVLGAFLAIAGTAVGLRVQETRYPRSANTTPSLVTIPS